MSKNNEKVRGDRLRRMNFGILSGKARNLLEPICYEEYRNMKTVEIADLVKARIQQKLDELAA